ncbi:hypothetical protein UFOVP1333_20 [uncultured Caudovirales phage]|uniref:Uncharacterized protein n=1 Tax=uncultured Caudovirales phage TaxID=2100421 RepID=A0A6J5RZI7_9CAUD|nr:hypothetical protein UFOVP1333_20 [uncultured Caudovirales phage]
MKDAEGPTLNDDLLKLWILRGDLVEAKSRRERLAKEVADLDVTIRRIPLAMNHIQDRVSAHNAGTLVYISSKRKERKPAKT